MRLPLGFVTGVFALLVATSPAAAQTVPLARADVDRDCTVSRADATIVQSQFGKRAGQPGFNPNADVDQNGVVNNLDVTFVTRNVGKNVCAAPAPTIVAAVAPPANISGWHNTAVTVSFTCTNAVSCPAPVTLASEGAAQLVSRTVVNAAGATAIASVTLNIDLTPPTLNVIVPATTTPGSTVLIPVTATDLSGLASTTLVVRRAAANTQTATPFTLSWAIAADAAPGAVENIEVLGTDRAGNRAAVARVVAIESPDHTPPTIALAAPAVAPPGATIPLTVQAADDRAMARVQVLLSNGGVNTPLDTRVASPFSFQVIGQIPADAAAGSSVTFIATATDAAGNTAPASAVVQVVSTVSTTTLDITVDPPVSPTFQTSGVITGRIGRATTSAPPAAPPILASLAPASAGQGQTMDVTITGVNTAFGPLSQVTFGPGVTVQSLSSASATSLVARLLVSAGATLGPRLVSVSTGSSEAFLADAFSIVAGLGTVTGRVVDANAQPIASAQLCRAGGTPCVTTIANGTFAFAGLPVDTTRLVASATGFLPASVAVALRPNLTSTVGDVALVVLNEPPPPPLPSSPPIAPALATVMGRGATELGAGGNPDQLRLMIRDAIVAVGGREMGVLDEQGQQLNPRMAGAGFSSFTDVAVLGVAGDMITGDSISLAKMFHILIGSIDLPAGVPIPTLGQLIREFQLEVDAAWADPSLPQAPMLMLLFNQGRVVSATPPVVSFDTQFNALQKHVVTVAFVNFVARFLPESRAPQSVRALPPDREQPAGGGLMRGLGLVAKSFLRRPGALSSASGNARWSVPNVRAGLLSGRAERSTAFMQTGTPGLAADRPGSLLWESVVTKVLPAGAWTVAKQSAGFCDSFLVEISTPSGPQTVDGKTPAGQLAAQDPTAKFLPKPNCKTAIELLEILVSSRKEGYLSAQQSMGKFFMGIGATRNTAQQMQQYFGSQSYQDAYKAAKTEAANNAARARLLGLAGSFVTGTLSKIQGDVVNMIIGLEVELVVSSLRPRQPFIRAVEQLTDPETNQPSRLVKIKFTRSPNDKGAYDNPDIIWKYQLYRGRSGAIAPITGKIFPKNGEADLEFFDLVPDDGTYVYGVLGIRQVGYPLSDPVPVSNAFVDKTLGFLGGFFSTGVKIGNQASAFSLDTAKIVLQPLADIYKGVRYQVSDLSDPEQIYISTAPPVPRPPASLAVHPVTGQAFLSVPTLNSIFRVSDGIVTPFAVPNFKEPGAVGLAIDSRGSLYTDNSASDALYGGRIFSFRAQDGQRDLAGTVNYFSQLLMFANPVAVQSLLVAPGPGGESLYIADAQNQRVTRMMLPQNFPVGVSTARNVSQVHAASPLFNFGPGTAMAMRNNFTLGITQQDNVLLVPLPNFVQPLFDASNGAPSPYSQLTGIAYDTRGNMYLSDSVLGTISMVPNESQYAFAGLRGKTAIDRKKLIVARGLRRPADLKLTGSADGLAFFDGERAFASLRFGMSGQLTDDGGAPVGGAQVYVAAAQMRAVTDNDGVFVLPNLLQQGQSPVVDFVVRHQGQTRSYQAVLDVYKHNIVDVVFMRTAPPIPPDPSVPPPPLPPLPSAAPIRKASTADTVSVAFELHETSTPPAGPSTCPRGALLSPALGIAVGTAQIPVAGLISNRWFSNTTQLDSVVVIVNGVATTVAMTNHEFTTTAMLSGGDNAVTMALPAAVLKTMGCADLALPDAELVMISPLHRVFYSADPATLASYRATVGFDLAVRAIVRDAGVPDAGHDFIVPGTSIEGTTDGDGIVQLNIPKAQMAGAADAADRLATTLFSELGQIAVLLRADRLAESLTALTSLLSQAAVATEAPQPAAATSANLLARIVQVEGAAVSLVQDLEAGEPPDPDDITALEDLAQQIAGLSANRQIVIRSRSNPNLTLTVSVQ